MRSVIAAVARLFAAVTVVVVEWSETLGRLIERCRPGHVPPDPQQLVAQYDAAAENVTVAPESDQRIAGIQAAAEALFQQQDVMPEMLRGLSPKTLGWLEVLDADMLVSVARAKASDLTEHLALRKQLRGVVRFEDDAIAEYRRAVEADARVLKRRDATPDRIYPVAWHLPAFGPMC